MKLPFKRARAVEEEAWSQTQASGSVACDDVWPLLSIYADKEASAEESALVEAHVAACDGCAQDLHFMTTTSMAFSGLPEVAPPPDLRTAILAATVDKPGRGRQLAEAIHRMLGPAPARYGFAAAAGLAGILVAVAINRGLPPVGGLNENPAIYHPAPSIAKGGPVVEPSTTKADESAPAPLVTHPKTGQPAPVFAHDATSPAASAALGHNAAVLASVNRTTGRVTSPVVPRRAPAKATTAPVAPLLAGGEMKLKTPIVEGQPLPPEEGSAHTADMVVMMDPKTMPMGGETTTAPMSTETNTPPVVTPRLTRIQFTSSQDMGAIATFAELKRALKHRSLEDNKAIEQSIKAGEIRVPVLKRTF